MDEMNRQLIQEYMFLDKKISRVQNHLDYLRFRFHDQTFVGSCCAYLDDGMTPVRPPRIEEAVISFVDSESMYMNAIAMLRYKKQLFKLFKANLIPNDRHYLNQIAKHTDVINRPDLNTKVLNEIQQIEEACGHKFNMYADEAIEVSNDSHSVLLNMNAILGMKI